MPYCHKFIIEVKNEDHQDVIIVVSDDCLIIKTIQDNGWIRNHAYYKNKTKEEWYEK